MGLTYGKLSSVPERQRMEALRSVQKELEEARQVCREIENLTPNEENKAIDTKPRNGS